MNLLIVVHKCHMYGFMCGIENGCSVNLSFSFICLVMACFVMLAKYTGDCRLHAVFCCPLEI
jgi:hypothetical protein